MVIVAIENIETKHMNSWSGREPLEDLWKELSLKWTMNDGQDVNRDKWIGREF